MRRSFWLALAVVVIGVPALVLSGARPVAARVFGTAEHIHVMQSTGQRYHDYSVLVGTVDSVSRSNHGRDTVRLAVGRAQYDATFVGAHVRLNRLPWVHRFAWLSSSNSALQTLAWLVDARIKSYLSPRALSPLQVQTAGLARVIAVHRVQRPTSFWKRSAGASSDRTQWVQLVEVEFWALRVRKLVRTIDVIDAGSIPGLHAGDIVQMHHDPREPRVMRLDDGMRTFDRAHSQQPVH